MVLISFWRKQNPYPPQKRYVKDNIIYFFLSRVLVLGIFILDNVAKSGMSAVQLVLLAIANFGHPISINDKTHGIRL